VSAARGKLAPLDDVTVGLIYCRVSSDEQGQEGVSLDDQLATDRSYCAAHRIVIGGEFQDIQSGTKPMRVDYQRMLAEARALQAEKRHPAVIVKFQDRLGRDMLEAARAYVELTKLGIDVHVAESGGVPSELEYYMRALIAQEESRNISRRIRSTFRYFAERQWHKPGSLAWGYRLRPATEAERADGSPKNVIELDEATAPYVRLAWERVAEGESMRSVALWAQGLPEAARGGRNLGYNGVRKVLRAPVYVGRLGGYDDDDPDAVLGRPVGRWARLIEDDVWRRVTAQRRLAVKMPKQARGEYLLTGLMRCSRCGSRMSGRLKGTQGGTRQARREYICHGGLVLGASNAERRCLMTVRADLVEEPLLATLLSMLGAAGEPRTRQKVIRELRRQSSGVDGEAEERRLGLLEAARSKTLDRMHALTSMRADGEIDATSYRASSERYRDELDRIDGEIKAARGAAPRAVPIGPIDAIVGNCAAWKRVLEEAEGEPLRELLAIFLDSVSPVRVGRGVYEPDYDWTATGRVLIEAAIVALSGQDDAESRMRREHLVRVDHLARTRLSTHTIPSTTALDLAASA
jgi:DNA invertase Pin-like site-specific DNA recombinase